MTMTSLWVILINASRQNAGNEEHPIVWWYRVLIPSTRAKTLNRCQARFYGRVSVQIVYSALLLVYNSTEGYRNAEYNKNVRKTKPILPFNFLFRSSINRNKILWIWVENGVTKICLDKHSGQTATSILSSGPNTGKQKVYKHKKPCFCFLRLHVSTKKHQMVIWIAQGSCDSVILLGNY